MTTDEGRLNDTLEIALERARRLEDGPGIYGYGVVALYGPDGKLKQAEPFANIITNNGDTYYATRGVAGIGTPNIAQPTLMVRMKLGTGVTAPSKAAGTNEVIQTYITGSNQIFDTTHPTVSTASANSGSVAAYKVTWAAGTATNGAITEATITSHTADSQGAATDTISRVVFTAVNKGSLDTLAITWNHKFLGS